MTMLVIYATMKIAAKACTAQAFALSLPTTISATPVITWNAQRWTPTALVTVKTPITASHVSHVTTLSVLSDSTVRAAAPI